MRDFSGERCWAIKETEIKGFKERELLFLLLDSASVAYEAHARNDDDNNKVEYLLYTIYGGKFQVITVVVPESFAIGAIFYEYTYNKLIEDLIEYIKTLKNA